MMGVREKKKQGVGRVKRKVFNLFAYRYQATATTAKWRLGISRLLMHFDPARWPHARSPCYIIEDGVISAPGFINIPALRVVHLFWRIFSLRAQDLFTRLFIAVFAFFFIFSDMGKHRICIEKPTINLDVYFHNRKQINQKFKKLF